MWGLEPKSISQQNEFFAHLFSICNKFDALVHPSNFIFKPIATSILHGKLSYENEAYLLHACPYGTSSKIF